MKTILTVFLFIASLGILKAQSGASLVGQPAPLVTFQYDIGKAVKPDFYKGKILVIDFWATWCAPCIANFPHFNDLAKTFQNNDVVFATLTDEPFKTVNTFFTRTKKQVAGNKLIDTTKATGNAFKVRFIPYSVVIDKDNIVRWTGLGSDLTAEMLSAIIQGKPLTAEKNAPVVALSAAAKPAPTAAPKPIFSFNVTPDKSGEGGGGTMTSATGDFIVFNRSQISLGYALSSLSGYGRTQRIITNDTAKLNQGINIKFDSKADTSLFRKYAGNIIPGSPRKNMIMGLLGDALQFDAKVVHMPRQYYELEITDSVKLHSFQSMQTGHSSFSDDNLPDFEIVGYNLSAMLRELENSAKIIITNPNKDNGHYDLSLNVSDIKTLQKTLNFHGLGLKPMNGDVEFLSVTFH